MNFLHDFLHQEVPKSGKTMPAYYRQSLFISEVILAAYFLVSVVLLRFAAGQWQWLPAVVLAATVACLLCIDRLGPRLNLLLYAAIIWVWLTWFVQRYGWDVGSPNILAPILSLAFFNIYEPPLGKIGYFLALVAFRVALFAYTLRHPAIGTLERPVNLIFQVVNSVVPLLILAINYVLFSSSIQARERLLTINNQELHKEAGTDPLTGLPNRRAMLDVIEVYRKNNPQEQFGIAIADIDFFKKVNDTYGHNCGDYTLRMLADLFREKAGEAYSVCRWGGEEFCFFLPRKNLDEAGRVLFDICNDVRHMKLKFEDIEFSITITVGVEENDFVSPLKDILEQADQKLYMGKKSGRDQVVI